ncbi:MAG: adenosylcobinamide amidohydrolase [Candidatus Rokuibacteriota bacterium]
MLRARDALTVVSSAVVGGGLGRARGIVNVHVAKDFRLEEAEGAVSALARRRGVPSPYVGLLTSAWTERAEVRFVEAHGITALAVVTVGLTHAITAGHSPVVAAGVSTINTIVVVDAIPEAAALVNAVIAVDEVKTSSLMAAGIRSGERQPATGTSTDAVVIAATGRGRRARFGGPVSELGWVVARATREAMEAAITRWVKDNT